MLKHARALSERSNTRRWRMKLWKTLPKRQGQKPFVGKLPVENMRPRSSHKVPTQPRNSKHKFKKKNTQQTGSKTQCWKLEKSWPNPRILNQKIWSSVPESNITFNTFTTKTTASLPCVAERNSTERVVKATGNRQLWSRIGKLDCCISCHISDVESSNERILLHSLWSILNSIWYFSNLTSSLYVEVRVAKTYRHWNSPPWPTIYLVFLPKLAIWKEKVMFRNRFLEAGECAESMTCLCWPNSIVSYSKMEHLFG